MSSTTPARDRHCRPDSAVGASATRRIRLDRVGRFFSPQRDFVLWSGTTFGAEAGAHTRAIEVVMGTGPPQLEKEPPIERPPRRRHRVRVAVAVVVSAVALFWVVVGLGMVIYHWQESRPIPSFASLADHPDRSLSGTVAYYDSQSGCIRIVAAAGQPSQQVWCLPKEARPLGLRSGSPRDRSSCGVRAGGSKSRCSAGQRPQTTRLRRRCGRAGRRSSTYVPARSTTLPPPRCLLRRTSRRNRRPVRAVIGSRGRRIRRRAKRTCSSPTPPARSERCSRCTGPGSTRTSSAGVLGPQLPVDRGRRRRTHPRHHSHRPGRDPRPAHRDRRRRGRRHRGTSFRHHHREHTHAIEVIRGRDHATAEVDRASGTHLARVMAHPGSIRERH